MQTFQSLLSAERLISNTREATTCAACAAGAQPTWRSPRCSSPLSLQHQSTTRDAQTVTNWRMRFQVYTFNILTVVVGIGIDRTCAMSPLWCIHSKSAVTGKTATWKRRYLAISCGALVLILARGRVGVVTSLFRCQLRLRSIVASLSNAHQALHYRRWHVHHDEEQLELLALDLPEGGRGRTTLALTAKCQSVVLPVLPLSLAFKLPLARGPGTRIVTFKAIGTMTMRISVNNTPTAAMYFCNPSHIPFVRESNLVSHLCLNHWHSDQ